MSTTSNPITDIQPQEPARSPISIGTSGLVLRDLEGLWRFSQYVAKSGLAPKGIQTPEAIFTAIQMGLEVGLTPMAALQNIAVINGRPSIWGDAQLGIVRGTHQLEAFDEWFEAGGKRLPRNPATYTDDTTAICRVKRKGYEVTECGFSVADAKTANLWGKEGPWRQYPFRMLKFRARSFALRDQFGDALKGILTAEEAGDVIDITPTQSVAAQVAPAATSTRKPRTIEAEVQPAAPAEPPADEFVLQNRLAAFVAGEGANFDDLRTVATEMGLLEGRDADAGAFIDLSDVLTKKLLGATTGLKAMLKKVKEDGGAR